MITMQKCSKSHMTLLDKETWKQRPRLSVTWWLCQRRREIVDEALSTTNIDVALNVRRFWTTQSAIASRQDSWCLGTEENLEPSFQVRRRELWPASGGSWRLSTCSLGSSSECPLSTLSVRSQSKHKVVPTERSKQFITETTLCPVRKRPKCFCNVFYKTWAILMTLKHRGHWVIDLGQLRIAIEILWTR